MSIPELKFSEIKQICEIINCLPTELERELADGWILVTDDEAQDLACEYIAESLWAFNAEFLANETGFPVEIFKAIQENGRCEDNNDAILALIEGSCGLSVFQLSAISADGRGHFLSSYDGNEYEVGEYYLYRNN